MFVRRGEDKVPGVKTFVVVARVAFIAAIALAGITSALSYLTAAVAPKCAGSRPHPLVRRHLLTAKRSVTKKIMPAG
jgi:hypothetical protein